MAAEHRCPLCTTLPISTPLNAVEKIFYECGECGLIFLDPSFRLDPLSEKSRYELHNNSPNTPGYIEFLSRATEPLVKNLSPGARGLDFGCGPGPTIAYIMSQLGFVVENYDPFFYPKIFDNNEKFDFIICTETLEHMFNPISELNKISELIVPGGYIAFMTEIYCKTISFEEWWYLRDPTHVSLFQDKTFKWIALHFGWRLIFEGKNVRIFQV